MRYGVTLMALHVSTGYRWFDFRAEIDTQANTFTKNGGMAATNMGSSAFLLVVPKYDYFR